MVTMGSTRYVALHARQRIPNLSFLNVIGGKRYFTLFYLRQIFLAIFNNYPEVYGEQHNDHWILPFRYN
jgi:hypothetical protein